MISWGRVELRKTCMRTQNQKLSGDAANQQLQHVSQPRKQTAHGLQLLLGIAVSVVATTKNEPMHVPPCADCLIVHGIAY